MHVLCQAYKQWPRKDGRPTFWCGVSGTLNPDFYIPQAWGVSVFAKVLVARGLGMFQRLLLALHSQLAHEAAQREVCRVSKLPRLVELQIHAEIST
jgi:hypothetical protein